MTRNEEETLHQTALAGRYSSVSFEVVRSAQNAKAGYVTNVSIRFLAVLRRFLMTKLCLSEYCRLDDKAIQMDNYSSTGERKRMKTNSLFVILRKC